MVLGFGKLFTKYILFSLYILLVSVFIFTVEQMMMKSEIEVKINLISLRKLYNHARNIYKMCVKFVSIQFLFFVMGFITTNPIY